MNALSTGCTVMVRVSAADNMAALRSLNMEAGVEHMAHVMTHWPRKRNMKMALTPVIDETTMFNIGIVFALIAMPIPPTAKPSKWERKRFT